MPQNNYLSNTDEIVYRHVINENLPPNTYSIHTHNMYELLYIISGDVTYVVEGRKYKLKKGDLIFIRPLHYHFIQIDSTTTYERYNILFDIKKNHLESARLIPPSFEIINLAENEIVNSIFTKLDLYYNHCDDETFQKILFHLLSELFFYLSIFPQSQNAESLATSKTLSDAINFINKNLYYPITVSDVANHLFVSESYLFRLFQKELHQTPKKYITDKKLVMADKMISRGEKPTLVCEKCGFCDYTTFYRNYTSLFGHPPSMKKL